MRFFENLISLILVGVVAVFLAYGCSLVIDGGLSPETIRKAMPESGCCLKELDR